MKKSINQKFRTHLIVLTIVVTVVFLIINISLYIINNNYLVSKIDEENNAFLQITTHIINENEIDVALEYIEHYTHIHEVEIEVIDSNENMIFSSNVSHKYTSSYQISTNQGTYTIFVDNTDSITVNRIERNTLYVNISLVVIYITAIIFVVKLNKSNTYKINKDIESVLALINQEIGQEKPFYHVEFYIIYETIKKYLENIDLLIEQKDINIKGLAHDIKTPLTIVYSFFERVLRDENVSKEDKMIAFESSKKVNSLLNDIINDNVKVQHQKINISQELKSKVEEYKSVFMVKDIDVTLNFDEDVYVFWNKKDLERVLDNLISNAYYYSKQKSKFEISIISEEKVLLTFESTPLDIGEIDTREIFKKGVRGGRSHKSNIYGKGLGLYLCKILLSNIHAEINARVENENVKFTIVL